MNLTVLTMFMWGLTTAFLLYGAWFNPDGTVRSIGLINGLETVVGIASFVLLFLWLWYTRELEAKWAVTTGDSQ